jgi:hypothetical protein
MAEPVLGDRVAWGLSLLGVAVGLGRLGAAELLVGLGGRWTGPGPCSCSARTRRRAAR